MALHDRRHGALDADAVGAHDDRPSPALLVEHRRTHYLVARAELEDVADLDRLLHRERTPACGARLALVHLAQVEPRAHLEVALHVDASQVEVVLVRPGHHVAASAQRLVGHDRKLGHADRAEAPRGGAERRADLLAGRGARIDAPEPVGELLLHQGVVAAQQHERGLRVHYVDERLDLSLRRSAPVEAGQVVDGVLPGRRELLGSWKTRGVLDTLERRRGLIEVRRVAAGAAGGHPVLARIARHHELDRLAAAHGPRGGLDGQRVEAAAAEDLAVRLEMLAEGKVETGLVEVERVRVLHGELARPQQAGLRARLVAELRIDLVPDLRELPVAAQLRRDAGEDLLVGHAEGGIRPLAIDQSEHLLAHRLPAPGALPELGGVK